MRLEADGAEQRTDVKKEKIILKNGFTIRKTQMNVSSRGYISSLLVLN